MVQRDSYCPKRRLGEPTFPVKRPGTTDGTRRPRGALQQLIVELRVGLRSVDGRRRGHVFGYDGAVVETPSFATFNSNFTYVKDRGRWAVRVGRHTVENVSTVSNGWLSRDRNPTSRIRPKASLTGFPPTRKPGTKVKSSEPRHPLNGGSG